LLVRTGCAFAEEPAAMVHGSGRAPSDRNPAPDPSQGASAPARWSVAEFSFTDVAPRFQLPSDYAPHEYRSLGAGLSRRQSAITDLDTRPALHASSAWDRLADFRTRGGIRLLTLWNSKLNSLSLQTGHGGRPSLQWTSRGFGGSRDTTQGVLDRLFATSIDRLDVARHALRPPARDQSQTAEARQ
jgi:hypothetical protein